MTSPQLPLFSFIMQIAYVQQKEKEFTSVHSPRHLPILGKPRKCLFTNFSVDLKNYITMDNMYIICLANFLKREHACIVPSKNKTHGELHSKCTDCMHAHTLSRSRKWWGSQFVRHHLSVWPFICSLSTTISTKASFLAVTVTPRWLGCLANFLKWQPSS